MAKSDDDEDEDFPELREFLAELGRRQRRALEDLLAEHPPELRERLATRLRNTAAPEGAGEEFAELLVKWANQRRGHKGSRIRYLLVWYAKHALVRLRGSVPDAQRAAEYLRNAMETEEVAALDAALDSGWKANRRGLVVLGNRQWQRFRSWLSPEQRERFTPYLAALLPAVVAPPPHDLVEKAVTARIGRGGANASSSSWSTTPVGMATVIIGVPLLVVGGWHLLRGSSASDSSDVPPAEETERSARPAQGPRPTLEEPAATDASDASLPIGPIPDDGRSKLLWTRHKVSESRPLHDVAWSQELGMAVVVGMRGAMWRARGLDDWTPVPQPATYSFLAVAHGAGRFVAVGATDVPSITGRLIVTSTDGVTWEAQNWRDRPGLTGVAFADGVWIAAGNMGTILRSTDGVHWESVVLGSEFNFAGVVHAGGRFILGGGPPTRIWTSRDGLTWTDATVDGVERAANTSFHQAACIPITCAAATHSPALALGRPGQTWTTRRTAVRTSESLIAVGDLFFLAAQEHGVLRSHDGIAWTEEIPATQFPAASGLGWTGRWMIAVALDGSIVTGVPRP